MATVSRENIGLLNDKITIKLSKEDYLPNFEKKVKEYSKTANIPGFRKGMVPTGMIKKMYGPSIYNDEILKTVEKQLYSYLDSEKPDIFAQPLPLEINSQKLDLNNPSDYEFDFEIGLKPEFNLAALDNAPLTFHKVKITDEMVQKDVERMQQTRGKLVETEKIGTEDDELTLLFMEANEEGQIKVEGINNVVSRRLDDLAPGAQDQLKGKGKDDFITLQLSQCFDEDRLANVLLDLGLDKDDEAAAAKFFQVKIVKVDTPEKRALDEAFFNEVFPGAGLTTEEAFRARLGEEIQQYWDSQSRNQLQDQLYHYLLDETQVEFPARFLKRWLTTSSQEQKTAEQAEEEFPVFSNQLKWTLITDKIVKDNNLEVSQDEVKASIKAEVMSYFGSMSPGADTSWLDAYIERMMKEEKQVEASYRRILTDKIFKFLEGAVTPQEKEVTTDELIGMQHHHEH